MASRLKQPSKISHGGEKKTRTTRKKPSSAADPTLKPKKGENVSVCLRIRPMNRLEKRTNQKEAWIEVDNQRVLQVFVPEVKRSDGQARDKSKQKEPIDLQFDTVFGPQDTNAQVFEVLGAPAIQACMGGYHACLFAYGQTSSGKTYTIFGSERAPGMIPQGIDEIFNYIEDHPEREYVLRVSYIEIYNEIVNDLLSPENTNLRIREDKRTGVFVQGLKEDVVMSADQAFSLMHAGTSHRHVGRTNYNDVSSRSHTVFRIVVESSPRGKKRGGVRTSALNIVDLAGSENAVKAGSEARLKETGYINKSLLTLGHVIYKLSENSFSHIPYRDSKLTRILQASLSGRSRVGVCCNISPSSANIDETISTLKFATRAKKIVNTAKLNEKMDGATLLKKYREEIEKLKSELAQREDLTQALALEQEEKKAKEATIKKMKREAAQEKLALEAKIAQLSRLILKSSAPPEEPKNSPFPQLGAARGNGGVVRRTPMFSRARSATLPRSMGAMLTKMGGVSPASMEQMAGMMDSGKSIIAKRPSLKSLFASADVDEETGQGEADDLLCDLPKSASTDSQGPDLATMSEEGLRLECVRLRRLLSQSKQKNQLLSAENEDLTKEIEEWNSFFVTNENKLAAVKSEVQRVAEAGSGETAELSTLFETLDMNPDDDVWATPLVALDTPTGGETGGGPSGEGQPRKRNDTRRFDGVMDRWRAIEQDR